MPEKVPTSETNESTENQAEGVVEEKADSGVDQPVTPEVEDPSGTFACEFVLNRGFYHYCRVSSNRQGMGRKSTPRVP